MKLKHVVKYENANALEVTWTEDDSDIVVKCQSYDDRQMEVLRSDLGESITPEIETLIQDVITHQVPLPVLSKSQKIAALTSAYKADLTVIQLNYLSILCADGDDAETKKADARQEAADRKAKYIADIAAVKAGTL